MAVKSGALKVAAGVAKAINIENRKAMSKWRIIMAAAKEA